MAQYSKYLGKRVEVHYRAGDARLSATATLVLDTGSRISLEERISHGGRDKTIRVEVPYDFLLRIVEVRPESDSLARGYLIYSGKC